MAYYLMQVSYTTEGIAALVKKPQNRREAVRKFIEKLGGSLEGFWFAFGDYDVVLLCQMPDIVAATAFSMAVSAAGAVKAFKTTPLMTAEEGIDAMKKATKSDISPPQNSIAIFDSYCRPSMVDDVLTEASLTANIIFIAKCFS
jgi:uncharacterized protein with GYD domain